MIPSFDRADGSVRSYKVGVLATTASHQILLTVVPGIETSVIEDSLHLAYSVIAGVKQYTTFASAHTFFVRIRDCNHTPANRRCSSVEA